MRKPTDRTYLVACRCRRTSNRWTLSILTQEGKPQTVVRFSSRRKAMRTANTVAAVTRGVRQ